MEQFNRAFSVGVGAPPTEKIKASTASGNTSSNNFKAVGKTGACCRNLGVSATFRGSRRVVPFVGPLRVEGS